MGLLDRFFKKEKPKSVQKRVQETEHTQSPPPKKKTAKELATERGDPYVAVIGFELDPNNMAQGSFELDWNDKFITNLVRAGYQMAPHEPENVIVDRWFQNVCRHVVLETWEQEQAMNPTRYHKVRNLGDGYSELS
jgi:hypothetical protein